MTTAPSHVAQEPTGPRPGQTRLTVSGGETLTALVLACTREDTTAVELTTGAMFRMRIAWPGEHEPDLEAFDIVEATVAKHPERDDLAQPEAVTTDGLPRQVGTLRGRKVRPILQRLQAPQDGPLFGFRGPSAPYWTFKGTNPSVALITPSRGPQLLRRHEDDSTWVRFGWGPDDVWLPMEGRVGRRALDAARRERLSGKDLATALGFRPHYLLTSLSRPREGHCYKVVTAVLPRG